MKGIGEVLLMDFKHWKNLFDTCMLFRHGETISIELHEIYQDGKDPFDAVTEVAEKLKLDRIDKRVG